MKNHYFDANALIKYSPLKNYKQEKSIENIELLVKNSTIPILISSLTLLETYGVLIKSFHQKILGVKGRRKRLDKIISMLHKELQDKKHFCILPPPISDTFGKAQSILLEHATRFAIGSNDALHLAIVLQQFPKPTLVTSDKSMKNVCSELEIEVYDPENELVCQGL